MTLIKAIKDITPRFGSNVYLADNATIIGDVDIGDDCSLWFNTVLRGDVNSIKIVQNDVFAKISIIKK